MKKRALFALALTLVGCSHNFQTETKHPTLPGKTEADVGVTSSELTQEWKPLSPYQACLVENEGDSNAEQICQEYNNWQRYEITGEDLCRPHDLYCIYTRRMMP